MLKGWPPLMRAGANLFAACGGEALTVGSNARAPPSIRTSTRNREIIVPSATLIEHSEVEITASQLDVPHIDKLRAKLPPGILVNAPFVKNKGRYH